MLPFAESCFHRRPAEGRLGIVSEDLKGSTKMRLLLLCGVVLAQLCGTGPACGAESGALEELDGMLAKAWAELAERGLPKDRKPNVAVVPFADEWKGVRRLGVIAAEIVSKKVLDSQLARLAEREDLDKVIKEQDTWIVDLFEDRDPRKGAATRKLLKADFLVLGGTKIVGNDLRFTLRLVESASGEDKAMSGFTLRGDSSTGPLLWYVYEPRLKPGRPVEVAPIQMTYSVLAQRRREGGGVEELMLKDQDVLRSRDQFQIHFQPLADCHVYILLFDSAGKATTLFPHPGVKLGNKVAGGISYVVPDPAPAGGDPMGLGDRRRWFWLNDDVGIETLYLVASYEPMKDLGALLKWMEQAGTEGAAEASEKVRKEIAAIGKGEKPAPEGVQVQKDAGGVDGPVTFRVRLPDERSIEKVGEVVRGTFAVVKEFRIIHK
jgi:TolB-like protein